MVVRKLEKTKSYEKYKFSKIFSYLKTQLVLDSGSNDFRGYFQHVYSNVANIKLSPS